MALEMPRIEERKLAAIMFTEMVGYSTLTQREGDVIGDGVNIAARLEPLAEPGGICIARAVCEQVEGKVQATLAPLGLVELKNLARPVEAFQVTPPREPNERPTSSETLSGGTGEVVRGWEEHGQGRQKSLAVLPACEHKRRPGERVSH